MKIYPAIDLIDGKCVRLTKGDFSKSTFYTKNPVDQAKYFEDCGACYLHIVDLNGAKSGTNVHFSILEKICTKTELSVDFGGGIRSVTQIQNALNAGCSMVNLGTFLISNINDAETVVETFGSNKLIAAIDAENEFVKTNGWIKNSKLNLFNVIHLLAIKGFSNFTVTDISRDGSLTSPAFELYTKILKELPNINLRASGGVSCVNDLSSLRQIGCEGTIIGKALYEGFVSLETLFKTRKYE